MSAAAEKMLNPEELEQIARRAFAQTIAMIYIANNRKDKRPGDPKIGGHPASCASSVQILGALHLVLREPQDYVCGKPHVAPLDHSYHHLLQLFRHIDKSWMDVPEAKQVMHRLRKFPEPGAEYVLQSYHARSDPDSFHFLPSGSVGIPPVVSVYLALAHRYARDHGWNVPPKAHFWSLIGDSEFREGSLLECLPDVAERQLGNVTWIIDYNRQNLDGTRIPNERSLHGSDCDRIERTCVANGWRVVQVRHGSFREELFRRPGGDALRALFEGGISDYTYQMLLLARDAAGIRAHCSQVAPACKSLVEKLSDDEILRAFADLGGHDMSKMIAALREGKKDPNVPTVVVAHTIKGWNLECAADPANHSILPRKEEVDQLLAAEGLDWDDPFALFPEDSPQGRYLAERSKSFRSAIEEYYDLRKRNRAWVREAIATDGGLPDSLGIDLSLFPMAHTQWMWGQCAAKLVRIGTADDGGPAEPDADKNLSPQDRRWKSAADFVVTLSPDVGTSTNISPAMNERIYGPEAESIEEELELDYRHPNLATHHDAWTRHIRFEIAEANCMSAVAAFGRMTRYTGLPFFPMMTVYDFFIKRALDQLYYNLYWGSEFVLVGTPSGTTLSPEGAQHSWKSDIQIPNLITWEPLFAMEMDWILSDAIKRHMEDRNDGRRGVLIRGVTRAIPQRLLLDNLRTHARHKAETPAATLKPKGAGSEWNQAIDESTLPALEDEELLERARVDCLAGAYYLVDWRGYEGYEPGDNVVNVFAMGSVATEALSASRELLSRGVFANVIVVSSPELLLGILGEKDDYAHLREGLGVDGDLHATAGSGDTEAGLLSIAGRRVPAVAVCDGEAGLLDNIGSIVGVKQITLAVRKFSKSGRPDQVYRYQDIDAPAIEKAVGRVLSETALENLRVSPDLLQRFAGRASPSRDWRALWPEAAE
jgi:pyruvate dehydrogenase E1 component